ncbi:MAG: hypothetical protein V4585_17390 [Bacteroidota bacterium]
MKVAESTVALTLKYGLELTRNQEKTPNQHDIQFCIRGKNVRYD